MVKVKSIFLYLSFVILTSAAIISCSDDDIINISTPVPVDSSQFRYPFTDGTSWNYKRSSFVGYTTGFNQTLFDNYPIIRTGKITILHDTVINFVTVKIFLEEYNIDNQTTIINRFYYINTDTALIYYSDKQSGNSSGFVPFRKIKNSCMIEKLNLQKKP
ncbi:MAG: hypothetical protein IPL53_19265 [Ignavibacteria bacterium]|nr:hypothetical protein [Ignavibacteria bacterium]